jgi:gamma-glutamyl-gamma-aminobutyrate hydrolase PuuD
VVFVVNPKTVLGLSYHPLTKSSKNSTKKPLFKVFVVFVVGPKTVLGLSYHPLTKSSKNSPKKPRFKVFVVFVVGVCGVCGRPQNRFGSIISFLDEI